MKAGYWKNLYMSQISDGNVLGAFKASLQKLENIEMLNCAISEMTSSDLQPFLILLRETTYKLEETDVFTLVLRFPMKKSTYSLFKELGVRPSYEFVEEYENSGKLRLNNTEFLLNYCYIRESIQNYTHFELFDNRDVMGMIEKYQETDKYNHEYENCGEEEFAVEKYYSLVCRVLLSLKNGTTNTFNLESLKYLNSSQSLEPKASNTMVVDGIVPLLRQGLKDPLLIAIVDVNGRVNGEKYRVADLLCVPMSQIYGIGCERVRMQILLCQMNSVGGYCQKCRCPCASMEAEMSTKKFHESVECQLTEAIVESNFQHVYYFLQHCSQLCTNKRLKALLKLYISESACYFRTKKAKTSPVKQQQNCNIFNTSGDAPGLPISIFCSIFDLFEMHSENETVMISFFKTAESYVLEAVKIIPSFMKTKKLYFAAFMVLKSMYNQNTVVKSVIKNVINRFRDQFVSVMDLILEYHSNVENGDAAEAREESCFDKEYLCHRHSILADMFTQTPDEFVTKNMYNIFNALYPSQFFTKDFVRENVKFAVSRQIMNGVYKDQVNDVDIMVCLLMNDYAVDLDRFFKPSVEIFVKKNLSHILFKIKNAYITELYCKKTCIYKIMKYVLSRINLALYLNYIWPYVEFFLNKVYCRCAEHFLEWLKSNNESTLLSPYMAVPFKKIEDLPALPNLEDKIYMMLARFISNQKIPIKFARCPYNENDGQESGVQQPRDRRIRTAGENSIRRFYEEFGGVVTNYSPSPLINDETFIERFLELYQNNKGFRQKINSLHRSLPNETRAIFGDLKYDSITEFTPRAPENIPKTILTNYLLKINYEQQDLFAFTIQEFLKSIKDDFAPEIENFVEQFRHTKFEYNFTLRSVDELSVATYRLFLESLFTILYANTKKYQFLKYLIQFDDATLEYACLCLIKINVDEYPDFDFSILNKVVTMNNEIHTFLLKINAFVGKEIINRESYLNFALKSRNFFSLIYCLEDKETDRELLQIAYFMVSDIVRVKGFNVVTMSGNYSTLNLFFDFMIDKNYKAAQKCLEELIGNRGDGECGPPGIRRQISDIHPSSGDKSFDKLVSNFEMLSIAARQSFLSKILKKIMECNGSEDVEVMLQGRNTGLVLHALKDLELLMESKDVSKTVGIIEQRRAVCRESDLMLEVHRYFASRINIPCFSRSVEHEIVRLMIKRNEYQKAEEEIAMMVLRKDYFVLYDHAQIKMELKQYDEAKTLLSRILQLCGTNTIEYFMATVKLCEINQHRSGFENAIKTLEDAFCDMDASIVAETKAAKLAKIYERLRQDDTLVHRKDGSELVEFYRQMQTLYFLTAKYFEKHDALISIKYYFKSFTSNHEAIPRFFHLIASASRTHMKIVAEMVQIIKKEYLVSLIPFYNQISTKLALETDSVKFYKEIVQAMLEAYPYQTHWNSLFLYNSKRTDVSKVISAIIEQLSFDRRKFFMDVKNCSEKFTSIARNTTQQLSMEQFPEIRGMFPAEINVPGQKTEINNVKNEIHVFRSLQMPKKIILVGEDGVEYPMIVKFKDDLRKDCRFMDLNCLLNKLFDEGYYVRTYNVIPFNHESGIIEFLPDLCNLKEIVNQYHTIPAEVLQKFLRTKIIGANNLPILMERFKPVFNRYLKETYLDPYQFYRSRENYVKTYAIMNVVGWFMGLGDRHAENIHFDRYTGDTVHVDLNCIFDRAKMLEIPEKVPFRLTQNIIDGFGVLKLEGTYKKALKHALEVMKSNRDVIQANLLSFVFDPLFEWSKKKTEPGKIIEVLNKKLDFEDTNIKISELIDEATDIKNLGGMYVGWTAFI